MIMRALQRTLKKIPVVYGCSKWIRDTWRSIVGPPRLKKEVEACAQRGEPIRIVIGSGGVEQAQGWLPTNIQYLNLLVEDHWRHAFGDNRLDNVLAEHVWEHLTLEDGKAGAARCFAYLKPGGRLRLAVPDGNHPDHDYLELVRPVARLLPATSTWCSIPMICSATCSKALASKSISWNTTMPTTSSIEFRGIPNTAELLAATAGPRRDRTAAPCRTRQ